VVLDDDGRIVQSNRAARALIGDREPSSLLDSEALCLQLRREGAVERELRIRDGKNAERVLSLRGETLVEGQYLVVLRDVTELRHAESVLDRAMRIESIGYVAASAVHDLNNLLTPIASYASLLELGLEAGGDQQALAREICVATSRAAAVVREVLAVMRPARASTRRSLGLNDTVLELRSLIERILGPEIDLELSLADGLPLPAVDGLHLERALLNLVTNARDAMPQGGKLRIETTTVARGTRRHVALRVTDTGTGMSEALRAQVLTRPSTSKDAGSGLGLLSVRRLMAASDGELALESEEGRGTSISLLFPLADLRRALEGGTSCEPQ